MSTNQQDGFRDIPRWAETEALILADLEHALRQDPVIRLAWLLVAECIARGRGKALEVKAQTDQEAVEWFRARCAAQRLSPQKALLSLVRVRVPTVAEVLGPFLGEWILQLIADELDVDLSAFFEARGRRLHRPKNYPIVVDAYGENNTIKVTIDRNVPQKELTRAMLEFTKYAPSTLPPKPVGRPPKPREAPPPQNPPSDDARALLALQAWGMKQQGLHWTAIARALWPEDMLPPDRKARDRIRKKVGRLIHTGRCKATSEPSPPEKEGPRGKKLDAEN